MSDLISRSELLETIKRYRFSAISNDKEREFIRNTIIKTVQEQTTAYDIGKVIEELSQQIKRPCCEENCVNEDDCCENKAFIKAIEIVKQGGAGTGTEVETIRDKAIKWNNNSTKKVPYEFIEFVEGKRTIDAEDDVCEWHCDEYGRYHTECHSLADNDPLEYTYCPYCGKKIKVVE